MKRFTKPATLEVITPVQVRLTISEGRYHQVKRMPPAGNRVAWNCTANGLALLRWMSNLAPGEYRPLTEEEIASRLTIQHQEFDVTNLRQHSSFRHCLLSLACWPC